jgi:hypothetical protein
VFAVRDGSGPRLVPLRVEHVAPPRLLGQLIHRDLFGVDADRARALLLAAVAGASRPDAEPFHPGMPTLSNTGALRLPGVLPTVWNVPVRSASFTGRDPMLLELRDRLVAGGPVARHALGGQGGVGKTQLAIEYTHRFANAYSQVWWVDAERADLGVP